MLTEPEDLDRLTTWFWTLIPQSPVVILLPGVESDEAKSWEEQINRLTSDCGCVLGAWFVTGTLLACCILALLAGRTRLWAPSLWQGVGLCVCAGVVGKAIGLFHKMRVLAALARKLKARAVP
ncbi:MAG TPA: hypothetical protein VND66_10885 [Acidobacteriaceae bacterium]|nr:hypothetical protein [Acidobacteriaceae bacterium]